jgi:hypothetical protein
MGATLPSEPAFHIGSSLAGLNDSRHDLVNFGPRGQL